MTAPNTPKAIAITFSSSGDNTLVAASTGNPITVWKIAFTVHAAVNVVFYSGASPTTPLSGIYEFTSAGSMVLDGPEGFPLFRTVIGSAFVANLSGAVACGGNLWYTLG